MSLLNKTKKELLSKVECYSFSEVIKILKFKSPLKKIPGVIKVKTGNLFSRNLYPKFQFDVENQCIYPVVFQVNLRLDAENDPWGVLGWWFYPSAQLENNISPKDLLNTDEHYKLIQLANGLLNIPG